MVSRKIGPKRFGHYWMRRQMWDAGCKAVVCFDNAMAESFWSTLKTEFYDRKRWPTRDAARKAVAYWIEVVYNRRRRHSSLGEVPPVPDFSLHHDYPEI